MPLPPMTEEGELPEGVHQATLMEVIERFGQGTTQRHIVTRRLMGIYQKTKETEHLMSFLVFGSYVTAKEEPGDIDIILIMDDDFNPTTVPQHLRDIFDHMNAETKLGASIFWTKPKALFLETLEDFKASWQVKRDQTRRGIVEVLNDSE